MSLETSAVDFLEAFHAFPGALLELSHQGQILASNGCLDVELGESLVGRRFPELLEESSREKWEHLRESPNAPYRFGELFFYEGSLHRFLILDVQEPGESRLRLIECGPHAESQRLISELTALNTELVNAHRDLSKKKMELENARREAAAQARDREELMRVVSHDLRAPLNVVVLQVALLEQPSLPEKNERQHLAAIQQAVKQAERLIRDLADAAAIQAGQFRIEPRPIELEGLISEARTALLPLATAHGCCIEADVAERLPRVRGDPSRLLQVLENLLGNAIKFTKKGDSIELRAWAEEGRILVSVADHGPGIVEEERDKVFERYWTSALTGRKGSGLGLSIARGIVEAHGGDIWLQSAVGHGTTFFVSLNTDRDGDTGETV